VLLGDEATPVAQVKSRLVRGEYETDLIDTLFNSFVADAWLHKRLGKRMREAHVIKAGHEEALLCLPHL
jgi:hypothetical protein